MREIKFRGLSRETNEFVYGMLMYSVSDSGLVIVETCDMPPSMSDPCGDTINIYHGIIQGTESQYIGLKNKNGKDIYEGDTVSGSYSKLRRSGYGTFNTINVKGVVEFTNTGQFAIFTRISKSGVKQYEYFNRLWPLSPDSYEIEITGNIHENIKQSKQPKI